MPQPHKLELSRAAVQHPEAEAAFALKAYRRHRGRAVNPRLLKEDFAGSGAVAAAWVAIDPSHRALAVERHGPTLRWGERRAAKELGRRAEDVHFVEADVLDV